jgi:hypothetical protein
VDWITKQSSSTTAAEFVIADLEYLGRRLDAVDDAGHKGAHATVTRFDAARYLTGSYLLLGDILRLASEDLGDTETQRDRAGHAAEPNGMAEFISQGDEGSIR